MDIAKIIAVGVVGLLILGYFLHVDEYIVAGYKKIKRRLRRNKQDRKLQADITAEQESASHGKQ